MINPNLPNKRKTSDGPRWTSQRDFNEVLWPLIKAGQIQEARQKLASASFFEASELRMKAHLEGKILLMEQKFDAAIEAFLNAIETYGPHVVLYADLATAYYLNGQYGLWKQSLAVYRHAFQEWRDHLHEPMKNRLAIHLAKFLEESGEIQEAYALLLEGLLTPDGLFYQKAKTHALRMEAQYKLSHRFLENYHFLKQCNPLREAPEASFERLHALALTEAEITSAELALSSLVEKTPLDPISKSLIAFDLAEIELRKKGRLSQRLTDLIQQVPYSHCYELKLREWILNNSVPQDWYLWPEQMPLGNYLRLAGLLLMNPTPFPDQDLIRQQWLLIVGGMTRKNQSLWKRLYAPHLRDFQPRRIEFVSETEVQINQSLINFSRKPALLEFLKLLVSQETLKDEDLCQELWRDEVTENNLAKIRQLTLRLNRLTLEEAAVEICEYSRGTLRLV